MRIVIIALAFLFCVAPVLAERPLSQKELMAHVDRMIDSTSESPNPEVMAIHGVLLTMKGLLIGGNAQEFFENVIVPYLEKELQRIRKEKSPGEAELEKYSPLGGMGICQDVQMRCAKMVPKDTEFFYGLFDEDENLVAITKVKPDGTEELVWGKLRRPLKKEERAI
jgi:hypothetical protein